MLRLLQTTPCSVCSTARLQCLCPLTFNPKYFWNISTLSNLYLEIHQATLDWHPYVVEKQISFFNLVSVFCYTYNLSCRFLSRFYLWKLSTVFLSVRKRKFKWWCAWKHFEWVWVESMCSFHCIFPDYTMPGLHLSTCLSVSLFIHWSGECLPNGEWISLKKNDINYLTIDLC